MEPGDNRRRKERKTREVRYAYILDRNRVLICLISVNIWETHPAGVLLLNLRFNGDLRMVEGDNLE
jgi:hypothetical protein